jgi:hypothetical protein
MLTISGHKGNANQNSTKIPVRIAIIRNTTNSRCCLVCGGKGTLVHCWWECKIVQPIWKKFGGFLKI